MPRGVVELPPLAMPTEADIAAMNGDAQKIREYLRGCFVRAMVEGFDGAKLMAQINETPDEVLVRAFSGGTKE